MSYHFEMPREGNLEQMFHIFKDINKYHNANMIFDPRNPVKHEAIFDKR